MTLPFQIEFDDRKDYAYARISAPAIDRQMAFAYLAEIVHKCAELRQKKLLLLRDIPAFMSDSDMIAALKALLSMASGMKIAIVNIHPSLGSAMAQVVNRICSDRSDCKYFEETSKAESWLMASTGS